MSLSMKSLQKKHHCYRQRCMGDAKDYQNYIELPKHENLHVVKPSKKKSKRPITNRSQQSVREPVTKRKGKQSKVISERSEVDEWRRRHQEMIMRNSELVDKLDEKGKKVAELRHKLKDSEIRIRGFEDKILHLHSTISHLQHPKQHLSRQSQSEELIASYQKQLRTLETNQKAMLEHLQKHRVNQREYHQYRTDSERKVEKLVRENEQLKQVDFNDKDYSGELEQLRSQMHKLSIQQHSPSTTVNDPEMATLRESNRELMAEREHLLIRVEDQRRKENELKKNLELINEKVEKWGHQYKIIVEERREAEERYQYLEAKLAQKKEKHHDEKEEWARIFKDLMHQIEKLKRQILYLEKSNERLTSLHSEGDQ